MNDFIKAAAKRLEYNRSRDTKRIIFARILNLHYKKNGYGHALFKRINVVDEPKGETNGKSE